MARTRRRVPTNLDPTQWAEKAARLIADEEVVSFAQARHKLSRSFGVGGRDLPDNRAIYSALTRYQALYGGTAHRELIHSRRRSALEAMENFEIFRPRLAGPVLYGTATRSVPVSLHLVSDTSEAVAMSLANMRIPADLGVETLSFGRQHLEEIPFFSTVRDGLGYELLVFPSQLSRAPCSEVDGKPMRRVTIKQLSLLLANSPDFIAYDLKDLDRLW
ncbi:MAG: hypothetical protein AAF384_05165 [Pseudomonadota bacterium]